MPLIEVISSSDSSEPAVTCQKPLLTNTKEFEKLDVSSIEGMSLHVLKKESRDDFDDGFMSDNSEKTSSGCQSGIFSSKGSSSSPPLSKKIIVEMDDVAQQRDYDMLSSSSSGLRSGSESGSMLSLSCETSETHDSDSSGEETCSNSSLVVTEQRDVVDDFQETVDGECT